MTSISVTQIKNWILQDPLLDYLNLYGDEKDKDTFAFDECNFTKYIMNKGNEYEKQVYDCIIKSFPQYSHVLITRENFYNQTKDAFKNKVDIILQPFIKNWDTKIFGFPDIVIKKKVLCDIFTYEGGALHAKDDDYVCIDVKYSSKKNEYDNYQKFIECQVMLYGQILNKNLKQSVSHAFILFKQSLEEFSSVSNENSNRMTLYPVLINNKEHSELCDMAFNWISYVRQYKDDFNLDECCPNMVELLPNMNNVMDYPWRTYKNKIAIKAKELSLISGLGNRLRNKIHDTKHYSFMNLNIENLKKCSKMTKLIEGFTKKTTKKRKVEGVSPTKKVYIDIESCYIFNLKKEVIIMIGCGYMVNGKFEAHVFGINDFDGVEKVFEEFTNFIKTLGDVTFVHFSSAENKIFNKLDIKNTEDLQQTFINLYNMDKDFNINGLSGFSIKEIMRALHFNNLVDGNPYDKTLIKSGIEVLSVYNQIYENKLTDNKSEIINSIKKYNLADVYSLYLLDSFLQDN